MLLRLRPGPGQIKVAVVGWTQGRGADKFLNIDSELPAERLKTLVRSVIFEGNARGEVTLDAVNRRGRTVQLQVTATPLTSDSEEPGGALLLMEHHEAGSVEG